MIERKWEVSVDVCGLWSGSLCFFQGVEHFLPGTTAFSYFIFSSLSGSTTVVDRLACIPPVQASVRNKENAAIISDGLGSAFAWIGL
jgi:hypothetical protein